MPCTKHRSVACFDGMFVTLKKRHSSFAQSTIVDHAEQERL